MGVFIKALSATVRFKKSEWLECHCYHYLLLTKQFTNTLLLGDSTIAGLSKYLKVWQRYFTPFIALNSGIEENQAESVLSRAINLPVLPMWFYYVKPTIPYYTQILLRI